MATLDYAEYDPKTPHQGLKRIEMAVKCFRQALQSLKESSLSDNQKTLKSHEITAIIKELRTVHGFNIAFEGPDAGGEREAGLPSERKSLSNP